MIRILILLLLATPLAAQTRSEVKVYLTAIGVKHVDIALAQGILESSDFTSVRAKRDHNLFGMKHPRKRATKSIGVSHGHAKYRNWRDSCDDYLLWQRMHTKAVTREKYLYVVQQKYAADPHYIRKLNAIMKDL